MSKLSFGFTYEELKLVPANMLSRSYDRFRIYLWGIETVASASGTIAGKTGFGFTYEELKLKFNWLEGNRMSQFRIYLWGIETPKSHTVRVWSCMVSDLPMRNWNCGPPTDSSTCHHCFGFTYEELKPEACEYLHMSDYTFRIYLWGIETPIWGTWISFQDIRFGFTYEELKLPFATKPLSHRLLFRIYLWGIETVDHLHPSVRIRHTGFGFTYEELKRTINMNGEPWFVLSFGFTYEELKLIQEPLSYESNVLFRIYLWGIETLPPTSARCSWSSRFGFTYEELKPSDLYWSLFPSHVSDLPMRNWNMFSSTRRRFSS